MNRAYITGPPANPVLQVLYFLVAGVLAIGAVLLGAVVLAFVLGFAIVLGIVVWTRVWWLKRKFLRAGAADGGTVKSDSGSTGQGAEIIEVEYTVVEERDPSEQRD